MAKDQPEKALSSFVWNETVFQSFQAGYIKALDFDFYKSLHSAISKRMFRFLDKRFYHRARWEFDLRTFACEHVGLSKNYSNSELKRKLLPAVRELEEREFLTPMPEGERFVQLRPGHWTAVFVQARKKVSVLRPDAGDEDSLVKELVERGITRRSAQKLVSHHEGELIREKVRLFDSLRARGGEGAIRNRAGWLYSAIVYDYRADGTSPPREASPKPVPAPTARATGEPAADGEGAPAADTAEFDAFWAALGSPEQEAFESEAVSAAPVFLQKHYHEGSTAKGTLWRVTRQRILQAHYRQTRGG